MESIGSIIFSLIGLILIVLSFRNIWKNNRIKRIGMLTSAKVVSFSIEDGIESDDGTPTKLKIPVFSFKHKEQNREFKVYRVKGKSNSIAKIGENTPIYYNPRNPEKEYYLPKKDFLIKYMFLTIGSFFFSLGVLMKFEFYKKYFNSLGIDIIKEEKDFFLIVFCCFFSVVGILFLSGVISYFISNKGGKKDM